MTLDVRGWAKAFLILVFLTVCGCGAYDPNRTVTEVVDGAEVKRSVGYWEQHSTLTEWTLATILYVITFSSITVKTTFFSATGSYLGESFTNIPVVGMITFGGYLVWMGVWFVLLHALLRVPSSAWVSVGELFDIIWAWWKAL